MPSLPIHSGKAHLEQKILLVDDEGHSSLLVGDTEFKRSGKSGEDCLPALINLGWQVVSLSPFSTSGKQLVLIQRQVTI